MTKLLLEILSEEIPARMQLDGAAKLLHSVISQIQALTSLTINGESFVTPRRIGFIINDVPTDLTMPDEQIRGPRINAPQNAIDGFLKKYNLSSINELELSGEFYLLNKRAHTTSIADIISHIIQTSIKSFVWPKSMKWGDYDMRWVRPIHSVICLLDDQVIPLKIGHFTASNQTYGHRVMASEKIVISNVYEYNAKLKEAYVEINHQQRQQNILESLLKQANDLQIKLILDNKLLEEVAGLVECPFVSIGEINQKFLNLPKEVLITTLRNNQKYFMFEKADGTIAPYFGLVANMLAKDGNKGIIQNNQRVINARLSDAEFFWGNDKKTKLESRVNGLNKLGFHPKIGTVYDKVQSTATLAEKIAIQLGTPLAPVAKAVQLMKADLLTDMVKEFPELQGIMGYYYALSDDEPIEVAEAIRDHYKPKGQSDAIPTAPVSVVLALAEKLDTLNQMFVHNIKPTGSKDPFALRRAAIGITMIQDKNNISLNMLDLNIRDDVINFINERNV